MPVTMLELDHINNIMNQLLDQKILKCNKPAYYAQQLNNLFTMMCIPQSDFPIIDPCNLYKNEYFYEHLSSSKDIKSILKCKMTKIVKKYTKIYILAVLEQCSNHSLSLY
jgi:hypothetical protein